MDIFDSNQNRIGQITQHGDRTEVYDGRGTYLGFSNSDGTFDRSGNRVAQAGMYMLLLR